MPKASRLKFAIVDIETTGDRPKSYKIIEIAIVLHDGTKTLDTFHSLVNPEEKITPFISRLTGIKDKDVEKAPKFYEIAKDIIEFTKDTVFVAHNVSFDYSVVRNEYKRLGYDFRMNHLCTVQTSRILIPGYKSYGLKNLTKTLGIEFTGHHRALADTEATAKIFEILFDKDSGGLEKFIKVEINPKTLNPAFDLNKYDDIPNKVGIYKFYNPEGELIYIGKSIHIKKRIGQHLKNTSTSKAKEMRQMITDIDYELTGSELIALLHESSEIKEHQPIYNRSQRTTNFSHGLYTHTDQDGYQHLMVKKNSNVEQPLITFTSIQNGKKSLEFWLEEYGLCQRLCHLHAGNGACFRYTIKECQGACIGEEDPESYNQKVATLLTDLSFNRETFLIVDKGRNSKEYSFVLIEDGIYKGYGYILRYLLKRNPQNYKKYITPMTANRDFHSIIRVQLDKNEKLEIFSL